MDTMKKIKQFISYCYLRYLLVAELYLMEPWEKAVVHVILGIIFILFWYFNYTFVVSTIAQMRPATSYAEIVK